jgi:hypothetical protein
MSPPGNLQRVIPKIRSHIQKHGVIPQPGGQFPDIVVIKAAMVKQPPLNRAAGIQFPPDLAPFNNERLSHVHFLHTREPEQTFNNPPFSTVIRDFNRVEQNACPGDGMKEVSKHGNRAGD